MINKHGNWKYNSNVPYSIGDRYYSQDKLRDFLYVLDRASMPFFDMIAQLVPGIISGGDVTKGSGNTLNISPCVGYAKYSIEIPDQYSAVPPTKMSADLECQRVSSTQQTNMAIPSAVLDNVTTNYIKLRYNMADGNTRDRQRAGGNYAYEQTDSFTFVVDTVAPTNYDICLGNFISVGGAVPATIDTANRSVPLGQFYSSNEYQTIISAQQTDATPSYLTQSSGQVTLNASSSYPFIAVFCAGISDFGVKKLFMKLTANVSPAGWNLGAASNGTYYLYVQHDGSGNYIYGYDSTQGGVVGAAVDGKIRYPNNGTYFLRNEQRSMTVVSGNWTAYVNKLYVGTVVKATGPTYTITHFPILRNNSINKKSIIITNQDFNVYPGDGFNEIIVNPSTKSCQINVPQAYADPGRELFIINNCTGGDSGSVIVHFNSGDFAIGLSTVNLELFSTQNYIHIQSGPENGTPTPKWDCLGLWTLLNSGWSGIADWTARNFGLVSVSVGAITGTPIKGELFREFIGGTGQSQYGRAVRWSSGSYMVLRDVRGTGNFTNTRTLTGQTSGATMTITANSKDAGGTMDTIISGAMDHLLLQKMRLFYNTTATADGAKELHPGCNAVGAGAYGLQVDYVNVTNPQFVRMFSGTAGVLYCDYSSGGNGVALVAQDVYHRTTLELSI